MRKEKYKSNNEFEYVHKTLLLPALHYALETVTFAIHTFKENAFRVNTVLEHEGGRPIISPAFLPDLTS